MSPATFGPMHYNNGMTTNNNNSNSQQATEHRQSSSSSSNNNNDNQSFVDVIGHGGGSGVGVNHCIGSGLQSATGKPIKHNNCDQADQHHHNKQPSASSQNYTDALKAAMAQEANQQHFRRTNSTAMRQQQSQQQQQQPPHRSFASSSSGAGSAMIDAQLDYQSRPARFSAGPGDMLTAVNAHHESNIYDVANCGPGAGR